MLLYVVSSIRLYNFVASKLHNCLQYLAVFFPVVSSLVVIFRNIVDTEASTVGMLTAQANDQKRPFEVN